MKWSIREAVDVYFKAKSDFKLGARTIRKGEPVLSKREPLYCEI